MLIQGSYSIKSQNANTVMGKLQQIQNDCS